MAESGKIAVPIRVLNYDIRVLTEESPEYVKKVSEYVDSKINEVVSGADTASIIKSVILAALNIADELFKEREKLKTLAEKIEEQSKLLEEKLNELEVNSHFK